MYNKEIIVQEGAILSDTIKNNLNTKNIIEVTDLDLGLQLLSMGKHDAAICPDIIANYLIKKNNFTNLEISDIYAIDPIKYCIAVNNDNDNLRILLDEGMGRLKAKGIFDKIRKKWFKEDNESRFQKYFYFIVLFVIFLLIATAITVFYVKRHISRVTANLNRVNQDMEMSLLRIKMAIKASSLAQWDYDCKSRNVTVYSETNLEFVSNDPLTSYIERVHPDDIDSTRPIINRI